MRDSVGFLHATYLSEHIFHAHAVVFLPAYRLYALQYSSVIWILLYEKGENENNRRQHHDQRIYSAGVSRLGRSRLRHVLETIEKYVQLIRCKQRIVVVRSDTEYEAKRTHF
jgi:hypothetical protein